MPTTRDTFTTTALAGVMAAGAVAVAALAAVLAGCAAPASGSSLGSSRGSPLTANELLAVAPGTPRDQVVGRFGPPSWTSAVRQENLTVLSYRLSHSECVIYQVSVRPDNTVRDVATATDPACDGPN